MPHPNAGSLPLHIVRGLAISPVTILLIYVIAEIVLRTIVPMGDPPRVVTQADFEGVYAHGNEIVWPGNPGQPVEYCVRTRINNAGFKDRDHDVYAAGDDQRYEVIGFGMSGFGPRLYLKLLQDRGLKYQSDLVIEEFLPLNDVRDDSEELTQRVTDQVKRLQVVSPRSYFPPI